MVAADNLDMSGYGQFCPVARASEVFAERWTPLILREIGAGHHHFSEILKGLHRASPSVLGQRLRSLERMGIVELRANPSGRGSTYYLTEAGTQLAEVIKLLGNWGQRWLELSQEHIDPDFFMWKLFQHLDVARLPAKRRVVLFEFDEVRKRYWLVMEQNDPDLCYSDPGFGVDLVVHASLEALIRVHLGQLTLADARRSRLLRTHGAPDLAHSIDDWFPRSRFASQARPVRYDRAGRSFVEALA